MKTIALVDYTLGGHHLSFMRSFSKILLEQGNKVLCVVPEAGKVKEWIEKEIPAKNLLFTSFEYDYKPIEPKRWGRFNDSAKVLHRWKKEAEMLNKIERRTGKKIDLVFYAWLDNQLAQYIPSFILDKMFPYKWSGLYFHPYHLRRESRFLDRKAVWRDFDSIFLSDNCIGVTVHDLGIVERFSRRIGKPVIHFPETADDSPPDADYFLAKSIREKSKERLVVGMIGCEKHKGTLTMMRMIRKADPSKYFFAFLGILPKQTFSDTDWVEVQAFIAERPENCFFHFEPVPEGAAYNAVFCSFDIPFLVYDDFVSSSNRLTKAAIFHKLVLSSNNYCVGEDVHKYRLGAAVPPQDADAALEGMQQLKQMIAANDLPLEEWKQYREMNSVAKLYERFEELTTLLSP